MKQAMIIADIETRRRKLDVLKVGDIHDEWQNDVLLRDVSPFAEEVCPLAFNRTKEIFNYNVPLECEAKIGYVWAETH